MTPRLCRCGHARAEHSHHRRGTDCTTCGISCLRYRPVRAVAWVAATFVVALVLLGGAVALAYSLAANGWWFAAAGAFISLSAASRFYLALSYELLDEHQATRHELAAAARDARRRRLAAVTRHPSSGTGPDGWDRALVDLIADHHRRPEAA